MSNAPLVALKRAWVRGYFDPHPDDSKEEADEKRQAMATIAASPPSAEAMEYYPKHTPTPWHAFRASWGGYVVDSAYTNVADIHAYQKPTAEQAANAAFIVRACNAHDALVEACELGVGYNISGPKLLEDAAQALEEQPLIAKYLRRKAAAERAALALAKTAQVAQTRKEGQA